LKEVKESHEEPEHSLTPGQEMSPRKHENQWLEHMFLTLLFLPLAEYEPLFLTFSK
jgi:hypothetical protein